jgi:hypothetical protein
MKIQFNEGDEELHDAELLSDDEEEADGERTGNRVITLRYTPKPRELRYADQPKRELRYNPSVDRA